MRIDLRPATFEDVAFLADVVITATLAQGRFPRDSDEAEYRARYEDWTRETILGAIPDCTLSVIEWKQHFVMGDRRLKFKEEGCACVCKASFPVWSALLALSSSFRLRSHHSVYLHSRFGACNGVSFVDSTKRAVCHNRRIRQHRVFRGLAERGKTSVDWFFGFKLHLVFNDCGEILTFMLPPGNVDDRAPVPEFAKRLFGKLFGDTGYLSQSLLKQLQNVFGVQLMTPRRKNMKLLELPLVDRVLLRKRAIVETIIDQLKNISQIEHTRHRSPVNFLVTLVCGLIAYCHQPKKPSLQLDKLPPLALA